MLRKEVRMFPDSLSVESSVVSYDQATAQRLWQLSAELTGLS